MAFFLVIVKAVIEIAGLALFGQFLVGLFAWGRRHENIVYRVLEILTNPFTRVTRLITPRIVLDQHIPIVTFLLLMFIWLFIVVELRSTCLADPQQRACPSLQRAA